MLAAPANEYWESRQRSLYYHVVRLIAEGVGAEGGAILDVGSNGCPYLDWFPNATRRTSLDLVTPYSADNISSVRADFLEWTPDRHYDVILCLQVLEHVPDAAAFARKLLACGGTVIASVPYRWKAGNVPDHIHDPVDGEKMRTWFGRAPNFARLVREVEGKAERLICVYEPWPEKWDCLIARRRLLASRAA